MATRTRYAEIEITEEGIPTWTFGDRLRKAREAAHLSQTQLADKLGVTRNTLGSWEVGASEPNRPIYVAEKL